MPAAWCSEGEGGGYMPTGGPWGRGESAPEGKPGYGGGRREYMSGPGGMLGGRCMRCW